MRRAVVALLIAAAGTVALSGPPADGARASTATSRASGSAAAATAGATGAGTPLTLASPGGAMHYSLAPGATQSAMVVLTNHTSDTTFTVAVAATGAASAWIAVHDTVVSVAPGATTNDPVVIAVPPEAPAGPAAASITASVTSSSTGTGSTQSVSVPVEVDVQGALAPSLTIGDVRSQVRKGHHELVVAIDNAGGLAADGDGTIDVPALQFAGQFHVHAAPRTRSKVVVAWPAHSNAVYDAQVTVAYAGADQAMWSGRLSGDGRPIADAPTAAGDGDGSAAPAPAASADTTASSTPAVAGGGGSGSPSPMTLLLVLGAIGALAWLAYELVGARRAPTPVPLVELGIDRSRFALPPISDELAKLASAIDALTATLSTPRASRAADAEGDADDLGTSGDARPDDAVVSMHAGPDAEVESAARFDVAELAHRLDDATVDVLAAVAALGTVERDHDSAAVERSDGESRIVDPFLDDDFVVLAERAGPDDLLDSTLHGLVAAGPSAVAGATATVAEAAPPVPWPTDRPRAGALDALKAAAELATVAPTDADDQIANIHAVLAAFAEPPAPVAVAPAPAPTAAGASTTDAPTTRDAQPHDPDAPAQGVHVQHQPLSPIGRSELIAEVARGLGISEDTLCRWMPADAFDIEPPTIDVHDTDAVARLSRTVLVLELQNEVLKRALSRVAE